MTLSFRGILSFLAALIAVPLAAQQAAPPSEPLPDLAAMSRNEVVALFRESGDRWYKEPCTFGVPVTGALADRVGRTIPIERLNLMAQAICADDEERFADGAELSRQITALTPDEPAIGLSLYFARRLEDADSVLATLRGLEGSEFEALSRDEYFAIGRMFAGLGRSSEVDAMALEWIDKGGLAFFDADLHSPIAVDALRAAGRNDRSDVVDQLLTAITSPTVYIDLLTLRDFEPFWPQVEQRAGPNLALVGDEHVSVSHARLVNASNDRDRFSEAAHALHFNGQFEDAIVLAQRWRDRAERGVKIAEGDAWALNIEAYAYDSLGQTAKADKVFDELAQLDPEEHVWVVNFVINRASRLTGQGRWKQGLQATELARAVAEKHGSTYAKLIIASDRTCALQRLGRDKEAESELAYLRENWKEGAGLTVRGLLCHGLKDEAAALLLSGLRNETARERTVATFQTDELDLFYTATILPQASDLPPDYPELAAELSKHMRPMPEAFVPRASLKRAALKEGAGS